MISEKVIMIVSLRWFRDTNCNIENTGTTNSGIENIAVLKGRPRLVGRSARYKWDQNILCASRQ